MKTEEHKVVVRFCDQSTSEHTYLDTSWGALQARDDFLSFVEQGEQNETIFAQFPHVSEVHVWLVNQPGPTTGEAHQNFVCPCTHKRTTVVA